MRDVGVIKFYINQDQLALLSTSVISCVIRDADNDQEIADAVWNVSVLWGRKYVFTIKFTPDEDENEETDEEDDDHDIRIIIIFSYSLMVLILRELHVR